MENIDHQIKERFIRQQYGLVGRHSAVKICSWTKRFIRSQESCYKHYFYGISTGGCLEMTPMLICNQRCRHCWRDHRLFAKKIKGKLDEPSEIIEGCLKKRKELLIGFKGNKRIDKENFKKCLEPQHGAISLTGEPCLYPQLPELVVAFYEQGFKTVFVVTNGTIPEMIKRLGKLKKPPTNIYLSLEAWDQKSYQEFCRPLEEKQYFKIKESLVVLRELKKKIRTILRITCIGNFNLNKAERFVWAVKTMKPSYIECKGYLYIGQSRERMEKNQMPEHFEVKNFAEKLGKLTNYEIKGEREESGVVLLKERNSAELGPAEF